MLNLFYIQIIHLAFSSKENKALLLGPKFVFLAHLDVKSVIMDFKSTIQDILKDKGQEARHILFKEIQVQTQ